MKGICVDLIQNTHKPHEVDIIIGLPGKRNPLKVTCYWTDIFISRDPTVDGSKHIHRNCLRDAIVDTYSNAQRPDSPAAQGIVEKIQCSLGTGASGATSTTGC
jgi:hypothetical protein